MSSTLAMIPGGILVPILAAIISFFYAFFRWHKASIKHKVTLAPGVSWDRQAIEQKNDPGVYRSGLMLSEKEPTVDRHFCEVITLYDAFMRGLEVSANGPCLGYRPGDNQPYHFISYTDVFRHARDFGSALTGKLQVKHGNESFVGIYAKNCPEWVITAMACIQQSIVIVPLYDTLGAEAAAYIVNQTEQQVVVTDSLKKAEALVDQKNALPTLRHIVVIEASAIPNELLLKASTAGVSVHIFKETLLDGQKEPRDMHLPTPDDLYIICYTSGTTGAPKGVMLTHKNVVANLSAFADSLSKTVPRLIDNCQSLISYLPLSHMMEQTCHWYCLMTGSKIGYFRGNILGLLDDMKVLKPTVFPVVPRLLNRLYDKIQSNLAKSGPIGRFVFNVAYQAKLQQMKVGVVRNDSLWDKLIFRKLQQELGGQVQFMCTGSAPVSATVLEMCRATLGATILEGYGQTETTAIATFTWPGDITGGHVGGPAPCSLIKLVDVPELEYFAKDGKGEVCVKGPSVTRGYYREPAKTAELIDEDGWLHTGDIGQLMPNGTFRIIDRKKNIFKLAQGEYVAPEKIENVYVRVPSVAQVFVDGNSLQRHLVAVVVPEPAELDKWYRQHVKDNGVTLEQMCQSPQARAYVLAELQQIGKQNKLNSIEQVKAVHLTMQAFTVENDLLTPTLKAKRPQLRKFFAEIIDQLYEESNSAS